MEGSGDSKGTHRSQVDIEEEKVNSSPVQQKESVDSHEGGDSSQVNGDVSGSESRGYEEYYSSESSESFSAESQVWPRTQFCFYNLFKTE